MTAAKPDHEFVPHPKGPDHYTGCTQYVEGQYCGLPRSAHATPPRSELADQLEALGKAATPGPWVVRRNDEVDGEIHYDLDSPENVEVACLRSGLPHDARLIVALVNALPEILTALRRTR